MDMHELYASGCRKLQDAALQVERLGVCQEPGAPACAVGQGGSPKPNAGQGRRAP
jgi:hypothetical protein